MTAEWSAYQAAQTASTAAYHAALNGTGSWADYELARTNALHALAEYSQAVCRFTGRTLALNTDHPLNPGDEAAITGARVG